MEFDINRVYTAVNADELKVGSKVIVANTIGNLEELVAENMSVLSDLTRINNVYSDRRFIVNEDTDRVDSFSFAYLISEPEEKKLKWTDLKIGDVIRHKTGLILEMVTGIDSGDMTGVKKHICISNYWITDEDLADFWEKVEEDRSVEENDCERTSE